MYSYKFIFYNQNKKGERLDEIMVVAFGKSYEEALKKARAALDKSDSWKYFECPSIIEVSGEFNQPMG